MATMQSTKTNQQSTINIMVKRRIAGVRRKEKKSNLQSLARFIYEGCESFCGHYGHHSTAYSATFLSMETQIFYGFILALFIQSIYLIFCFIEC